MLSMCFSLNLDGEVNKDWSMITESIGTVFRLIINNFVVRNTKMPLISKDKIGCFSIWTRKPRKRGVGTQEFLRTIIKQFGNKLVWIVFLGRVDITSDNRWSPSIHPHFSELQKIPGSKFS